MEIPFPNGGSPRFPRLGAQLGRAKLLRTKPWRGREPALPAAQCVRLLKVGRALPEAARRRAAGRKSGLEFRPPFPPAPRVPRFGSGKLETSRALFSVGVRPVARRGTEAETLRFWRRRKAGRKFRERPGRVQSGSGPGRAHPDFRRFGTPAQVDGNHASGTAFGIYCARSQKPRLESAFSDWEAKGLCSAFRIRRAGNSGTSFTFAERPLPSLPAV